jgi:Arc/MetJ-type ribon-helix-helix transcriptional regulator
MAMVKKSISVTDQQDQWIKAQIQSGHFGNESEVVRELIRERTKAGLAAARARGRKGGRRFDLSKTQVRLAQVAMQNRDTKVSELCQELGVTRSTLYRYVGPSGELRKHGERVLGIQQQATGAS